MQKYRSAGFNLIGFPCNQFGGQAPKSSDGERDAAFSKFGFEFPIMVSAVYHICSHVLAALQIVVMPELLVPMSLL